MSAKMIMMNRAYIYILISLYSYNLNDDNDIILKQLFKTKRLQDLIKV
jgi:hypothetical protein